MSIPTEPDERPAAAGAGLPAVSGDFVEQDAGDDLDNIIPTRGYEMLPMIGLGGSAGSIGALQQFFAKMPPDSGMTFVVILHLSPEHESTLAELLQRCTAMPVVQARGNETAEANRVYVIPPGKHLTAVDGHLRLSDLEPARGKRVAVDLFFRTLADTHGPHAAAIILSGADGDGAIGIKRIKERGGLTIAQDPDEAEHPSMPRSSIATGMVDWVLPVEEMPGRLVEYHLLEQRLKLPPEEGPPPAPAAQAPPEGETALREVLAFLRARTGRDFSYYKRATILRRLSRRLQVNGLDDLPSYLTFLRTHPGEAGALLQDLLISVTNFFRDRDAFETLEARVPGLFRGKGPNDTVRVWVPACATGEEAYSIAILLCEHARTLDAPPVLQVFATDLDEQVVQFARAGLYQETVTADVSEERLRRFFVKEHHGYRVRRELREIVLFAMHDLLKDAPFSRLDLVSCRNLLIYLNRDAQARAMDIFYFALRPGCLLFLGSSESVEEGSLLFAVLDKKHRLYTQRGGGRVPISVPSGPGTFALGFGNGERAKGGPMMPGSAFQQKILELAAHHGRPLGEERGEASWSELHFKLIEHFAPPSLIVNESHDILHLSASVGRFLHFGGGEPTMNLMRVIHPMLRIELRAALFRASQNESAEALRVPVELEGEVVLVDLRVALAADVAPGFLLVTFQTSPAIPGKVVEARSEPEPAVRGLERELEGVKSNLRDTVEQYEASTEELRASNEELQAMNEELRSATEELETGREELQSINEELTTVNSELKGKVDELGHANSDLQNLMASTAIATIFLDRGLRIMRYTPTAVPLFNLIPSDLGRPLSDLTHQLDYLELKADAIRVLDQLTPIERVVSHGRERWYLARMLPYRTTEDRISGVVLTFVDITERRRTEQSLLEREQQLALVIESAPVSILYLDAGQRVRFANRIFLKRIGRTEEQTIGRSSRELLGEEEYRQVETCLAKAFAGEETVCEVRLRSATGEVSNLHFHYAPALGEAGEVRGVVAIASDVTGARQSQEALTLSEERMRLIFESAREYAIFSADLERRITSWNEGAERLLGYTEEEVMGQPADVIFTEEDRASGVPAREAEQAIATGRASDERWHERKDGTRFWASGAMMAMLDEHGQVVGILKILRDQSAQRAASEELERSRAELWAALQETEQARAEAEAAGQARDQFLAVLSHELRTPLTPVLVAVHALARRQDLPEAVVDALGMIRRNVEMEAHFIDDLLDLTRIARGKIEIASDELDLHDVVRRAVEVSAPDFEAKGQTLEVALEATGHRITGDAARLPQALWNLLKNASKFTPERGEISLRSRNTPGQIVIEVVDNGIGIDPAEIERIFHPFEQANRAIAQKYGGLGLGLAIARATVLAHGGELGVKSAGLGQGTAFTLTLPLSPQPASAVPRANAPR